MVADFAAQQSRPFSGVLTFLAVLLRRPTVIVEHLHPFRWPRQVGRRVSMSVIDAADGCNPPTSRSQFPAHWLHTLVNFVSRLLADTVEKVFFGGRLKKHSFIEERLKLSAGGPAEYPAFPCTTP